MGVFDQVNQGLNVALQRRRQSAMDQLAQQKMQQDAMLQQAIQARMAKSADQTDAYHRSLIDWHNADVGTKAQSAQWAHEDRAAKQAEAETEKSQELFSPGLSALKTSKVGDVPVAGDAVAGPLISKVGTLAQAYPKAKPVQDAPSLGWKGGQPVFGPPTQDEWAGSKEGLRSEEQSARSAIGDRVKTLATDAQTNRAALKTQPGEKPEPTVVVWTATGPQIVGKQTGTARPVKDAATGKDLPPKPPSEKQDGAIQNFDSALSRLNTLETLFKQKGVGTYPGASALNSLGHVIGQEDPRFNELRSVAGAHLLKGIKADIGGRITNFEIRYGEHLFPTENDRPEVALKKVSRLRQMLSEDRTNAIAGVGRTGRDTSGWMPPGSQPGGDVPDYATEVK